ncbi:MAG: RloB domain-containing protein [Verrucomicrobiales bacterium]|nr:RloB domain-containing protein [Verrucomicrobiales bacterium]MCP5526379.1 RloB domain-containing protein [Verrucomicrobiales bacterium]
MNRFQRRHRFRDPKKFFIIATEGECTEDIYFTALKPPRDAAIQLKVLPTRKGRSHPRQVLERLKNYDRDAGSSAQDELWLVVDKDAWTEIDLDDVARALNGMPRYHLALSNPCFELWLVLHRRDSSGKSCAQLQAILEDELGAYRKNGYDAEKLKPGIEDAITRARRIDTPAQEPWPRADGTQVYRLVQKLAPHQPPADCTPPRARK